MKPQSMRLAHMKLHLETLRGIIESSIKEGDEPDVISGLPSGVNIIGADATAIINIFRALREIVVEGLADD